MVTTHAIDSHPNSHTIGWARYEPGHGHTLKSAFDVKGEIRYTMRAMGPNPPGCLESRHIESGYTDDLNTEAAPHLKSRYSFQAVRMVR